MDFYTFVTTSFCDIKEFFHFPIEWYLCTHKYITKLLALVTFKHPSLFLDASVMKYFYKFVTARFCDTYITRL